MKSIRLWLDNNWRAVLSRAPLPMLALAASWGVYSFAALYVPWYIAVIQAAAFELTYLGLAITRGLTEDQRQRATYISIGAVIVSVLYNSIDGFFVRNPAWLVGLPWQAEALGAFLHGAPLAVVAYLVADLLLHSSSLAGSAAHEDDSYIGAQPGYAPARVMDQPMYPAPVLSAVRPRDGAPIAAVRPPIVTDGRTDGRTDGTESQSTDDQTDGATSQSSQTPIADKTCKYCGTSGLTSIMVARHGRARKRSGVCPD